MINAFQLLQRGAAGIGGQWRVAELAQTQEQRPANGCILLLIETLENCPDIGAQRTQTMNQITPYSGVIRRSTLEQGPDPFGLAQAQQRRRRIHLPLRKLFSPVGIVFKGSGFYRTDSRSSSVNGSSKVNGSAADSSSTGEKSSGADAKPAGSDSGSSGTTAKSEKKADKGGSGTSSGAGAKVA